MKSSVDPTLFLESDKYKEVVLPMQYLVDPTPLLGSDVSFDHDLRISILVHSEQGGIPLSLSTLPLSSRMVSFDWNDLVETLLPSSTPFQIMFGINSLGIRQSIVDEGSYASILSSSTWKSLGSPKLVSATSEFLAFERRHRECMGFLPQFPTTLGENTILFDLLLLKGP
jgi:hypothetical protein